MRGPPSRSVVTPLGMKALLPTSTTGEPVRKRRSPAVVGVELGTGITKRGSMLRLSVPLKPPSTSLDWISGASPTIGHLPFAQMMLLRTTGRLSYLLYSAPPELAVLPLIVTLVNTGLLLYSLYSPPTVLPLMVTLV